MFHLNGKRVIFPVFLSGCATAALASAVFYCNFLEISHSLRNVRKVSIGFWQTTNELNGDVDDQTKYKCVPWTAEQAVTFDALWNYGRYNGCITFALGVLATLWLATTACYKPSKCGITALTGLQVLAAVQSAMLLLALHSTVCDEFDCFIDIGGVLCVAASIMFFIVGFLTLTMDYAEGELNVKDYSESFTERYWDRSEMGIERSELELE